MPSQRGLYSGALAPSPMSRHAKEAKNGELEGAGERDGSLCGAAWKNPRSHSQEVPKHSQLTCLAKLKPAGPGIERAFSNHVI